MIRHTSTLIAIGLVFLLNLPSYGSAKVQQESQQPIYKLTVNVVERTTTAINYRHRSGATSIDFRGTPLLPEAYGEAKVESKQGYIEIEVEFDELEPATRFGPEYLTYVMWAITPEGRATNLGEVILNGSESKLNVTSELQAFGLIVTAEPYFAVSQPSDVVVMENFVRDDTKGKIEEVNAKFELLQRGVYVVNVPPADLKPIDLDEDIPLDLYQARNALRIARWAGADKDASDSYGKATSLLQQAEAYQSKDSSSRAVSMTAREAVQTAEDARLIALKRQEVLRLEAAADREAQAVAEAEQSARLRVQAEQEQKLEAERRARAEADRAAAEAATARARMEAELAAERASKERESIAAEADQARKAAEQAEREKAELRQQLVRQLNLILETRDSARGLIVNMSDVLFDTARYNLRPGAREKLAKISGIVLSHPGLILEVEGHTDSVGTDEYNMDLSEKRAKSVRDFLIQEGINPSTITARGFGESQPVTTNDTATGRQQNRRVELVVSGEVIGSPLGPNTRLTPGNQ